MRGQVNSDALQHRRSRARQARTPVGFAHIGQLDLVGVNLQGLGPTPRIEDAGPQNVLIERAHNVKGFHGQESFPGLLEFGRAARLCTHPQLPRLRVTVAKRRAGTRRP
ncbi:hypothetical protein MMARJ_14670 [Mycobacterium marseillense]|uniref:Uncharacterized protein n=1 Tax=Mycobacterium marseillense TaxID=701042 RepID=A0ABN5ZQK5_9MYCO|nr:hypothetical protein MMARJ_14670 [Mycobacterium marseillense]